MMTPERWATAKEIFAEAQELAQHEREDYSKKRLYDDPELLEAVFSLLRSDVSAGSFLEQPYAFEAPELFRSGRSLIGEMIGAYRFSSLVAEAGSSSLYRAHRVDGLLQRDVAIKVYWTEPHGIEQSKRLLAETLALSSLDHQGICRLYDVIALESEAYCAILEWIDGEDIKLFCDNLRMPIKDRVQLLLPALEALQHVHVSGFLHGDIKEEHILATSQLKTKLIDFGSARKVFTAGSQNQAVLDFTPEYASPELLRGEMLDTRSDLYSFGILMYRVLLGRHPYGLRSGLITDIADLVLNEEPQSALALLTAANAGTPEGVWRPDTEDSLARQRSISVSRLRTIFSTDLSLIMLKAIQKERKDRYQTASDLIHDLRLWLGNRPTIAGAYADKMLLLESHISSPIKVFLCHCSEDKPRVRELNRQLRAIGVTTWLDEDDLLPGQEWREEISKAVTGADVVVVCLSDRSLTKKGFVQKEIRFALDVADEQPPGHIFIIPVRLVDCDVPDRLKKWQWVNLFEDQGFRRLVKALSFHSERCRTSES